MIVKVVLAKSLEPDDLTEEIIFTQVAQSHLAKKAKEETSVVNG